MKTSGILKKKIVSKKAQVAVIGLGYVGLPLAVSFIQKGFKVFGIDTNAKRVERLCAGESYITDIKPKDFVSYMRKGKFVPTTDFNQLDKSDVVIICVPTPLKRKYTPDISFMVSAVRSIAKHLHAGMLVVLESTTYPGTTEELIKVELEKSGFKVGRDFHLAFSPERVDPGNKTFDIPHIPKVVGGVTQACTDITTLLYSKVVKNVHPVSTARAAEMTKLLENSFRIVNIGWINEIAQACHKMDIDVWEVIEAAKTKPFGFMPFYPGLGVGGHCIPEDPLYLYWKAKRYGINSKFIKLAADTNAHMPNYVVHRLESFLKKSLTQCKILIIGVTYKKDVKDLRKSPSIRLIELLKHHHSAVDYHDPLVPFLKIGGINLKSVALDARTIKQYNCVVICVDHSAINYDVIRKNGRQIFDVKNIYKNVKESKIERL
jgi:UDP-N-acetyl-D-glucosamine dehydrogenase